MFGLAIAGPGGDFAFDPWLGSHTPAIRVIDTACTDVSCSWQAPALATLLSGVAGSQALEEQALLEALAGKQRILGSNFAGICLG